MSRHSLSERDDSHSVARAGARPQGHGCGAAPAGAVLITWGWVKVEGNGVEATPQAWGPACWRTAWSVGPPRIRLSSRTIGMTGQLAVAAHLVVAVGAPGRPVRSAVSAAGIVARHHMNLAVTQAARRRTALRGLPGRGLLRRRRHAHARSRRRRRGIRHQRLRRGGATRPQKQQDQHPSVISHDVLHAEYPGDAPNCQCHHGWFMYYITFTICVRKKRYVPIDRRRSSCWRTPARSFREATCIYY